MINLNWAREATSGGLRLTRRPVSLKLSERQVNGLADDSLRQGSCKPQPLKGARLAALE
jgi:hypothetical protein